MWTSPSATDRFIRKASGTVARAIRVKTQKQSEERPRVAHLADGAEGHERAAGQSSPGRPGPVCPPGVIRVRIGA